jgi:hypothetical protein
LFGDFRYLVVMSVTFLGRRSLLAVSLAVLLAGCGSEQAQRDAEPGDPVLSGALADQIMVDPDLVGQNRIGHVASLPWRDGSLPAVDSGPQAIAAARAEAFRLVGGPGRMREAPQARAVAGALPEGGTLTAAARAAASPGGGNCASRAQYTMHWAARLPSAFPVYPHGAVQEAAGTDEEGCSLRVINFITPVPPGEVMNFYFTRGAAAGFSSERLVQEGDDVLAGVRGQSSYLVYARRLSNGDTEVDLVTSGS